MDHVMIDLETLGKRNRAVIIAIGAVMFDRDGVGATFYCTVDPQSCVDAGLEIDVDTVMWWMQQSDEARAAFKREGFPLATALAALTEFLSNSSGDLRNLKVWGNGATFDNTILTSAYDAAKLPRPWEFWNDRCYRTVKSQYPTVKLARTGTHHNALADAIDQANHLIAIGAPLA